MSKLEKYAVGVDLGGTSIKIGLVSAKGKIVNKICVDTLAEHGPKVVISQIKKGIRELLSKNKKKILGIGIGSPGIVSMKKGTVENPPNLPGWEKINLGRIISKEFNTEVVIENDANAAAIGEMIFGAGKKHSSFVMVTLGTGVGGGIVLKNKIYRGEFGGAGEIGHVSIDMNGNKCNCGNYGCIETYVGNNYMMNRLKEDLISKDNSSINKIVDGNYELLTPKIVSDAMVEGDKFALEFVQQTGVYLGAALASVSNLIDVSTFIVGGGVAGFGAPLFNSIEITIKQRVLTPLRHRVKVIPAILKNDAGVQGASALVFYKQ